MGGKACRCVIVAVVPTQVWVAGIEPQNPTLSATTHMHVARDRETANWSTMLPRSTMLREKWRETARPPRSRMCTWRETAKEHNVT